MIIKHQFYFEMTDKLTPITIHSMPQYVLMDWTRSPNTSQPTRAVTTNLRELMIGTATEMSE